MSDHKQVQSLENAQTSKGSTIQRFEPLEKPSIPIKETFVQQNEPLSLYEFAQEASASIDKFFQKMQSRVKISFAGDILLSDNVGKVLMREPIYEKRLQTLFQGTEILTNASDLMVANLENPISERGEPISNKQYLFRAHPNSLSLLHFLGIDAVSIANNHTLDYGEEAFTDTLQILKENNISYLGGGTTRKEANEPLYVKRKNVKIALIASSRVIPNVNWYATDDKPGVAGFYDTSLLFHSVKEAAHNADIVVVYLHWGEESKEFPASYQKEVAKQLIDAGCHVVVGAHPHVLQGIEFYKNGVIMYSLGNFIFTNHFRDSIIFSTTFEAGKLIQVHVTPVSIRNYFPVPMKEEQKKAYFQRLENLSFTVRITPDGEVLQAEEDVSKNKSPKTNIRTSMRHEILTF